jgi:hypothetical protein
MSVENVKAFFEKLQEDRELMDQLKIGILFAVPLSLFLTHCSSFNYS